jgi:hypothetical protein
MFPLPYSGSLASIVRAVIGQLGTLLSRPIVARANSLGHTRTAVGGDHLGVRAGCHRSTLTAMRAMGIDVSVTHGLDVVVLDESGRLVQSCAKQTLPELARALEEVRPDIIAIDSPPGWAGAGRSRPLERELARLGISMYATQLDPGDQAVITAGYAS